MSTRYQSIHINIKKKNYKQRIFKLYLFNSFYTVYIYKNKKKTHRDLARHAVTNHSMHN